MPGRIDKNDLRVVAIQDSLDTIARGLRLGRDDGDFLTDQRVYESGFARVWAANNRDEAGFERHEYNNCTPLGPLQVASANAGASKV